jgi:hypothetical protein
VFMIVSLSLQNECHRATLSAAAIAASRHYFVL